MAEQSEGERSNSQPSTPTPPANPYAAAEAAVLEQLWRAVGGEGEPLGVEMALARLALDDLGHPEALAKVRELRAALAQPQPDVAYILELRRWFAARPGPARQAAARFFGTPAVAALLQAALNDEV
jgi:hypothetical protein